VFTVGIQVYRNVQNYNFNKQQFVGDVQVALDNGVEAYYAEIARDNIFSFIEFERKQGKSSMSVFSGGANLIRLDSNQRLRLPMINEKSIRFMDSASGSEANIFFSDSLTTKRVQEWSQSVKFNGLDTLASLQRVVNQIMVSITRDTVDFSLMQGFISAELERKNLGMNYDLVHYRQDTIIGNLQKGDVSEFVLNTASKSNFLPRNEKLEIQFENASLVILKRGMTDLLISLLIIFFVVGSLFYLYRVINAQKELAEIKNDLINNITHEFKTPIATIATAIDGIVNFNVEKDEEKTKKYLNISSQQLIKLNHMVEKLLETATLDSDKLLLTIEEVDVKKMLDGLRERYQLIALNKKVNFHTQIPTKVVQADMFHLENAISNLIDNAVKYGGDNIDIYLVENSGRVKIKVEDDGHSIDRSQRERIFEKFYRIPTGNRHDVKGFGIGLYYTKKIIEKHGGSVLLSLDANKTSFEVAL